jgi:wyosine [tRNA(Phe)-imidazoG37] synthetase (radical SAM superfamily)
MPREYTYGPFQSRRLKLSLGVDILPKKKCCTYDCVIKSPPSANFRKELIDILKYVPHLNSITYGYNGEPTLNENIIDFYKIAYQVREKLKWTDEKPKLTLFTNSSTLYSEEVRGRVKQFDLVLAKLDSATEEDFQRTNHPHKDCPNVEIIVDSLVKLKKEMPRENKLAIQCLISSSYREDFISNDNPKNIEQLANAIKKIKPDYVQVYSIARIPAQYYVFAISEERKQEIVNTFEEIINDNSVEVNYY